MARNKKNKKPAPAPTPGNDPGTDTQAQQPEQSNDVQRTDKQANGIVQLQSNRAGHHAGETFTRGNAKKLGVLEYCQPFPGQNDRSVKPQDVTTR